MRPRHSRAGGIGAGHQPLGDERVTISRPPGGAISPAGVDFVAFVGTRALSWNAASPR
ncbi:MAG: hypothetical protein HY671_03850 [Chloroflexi bacterium]|nr:hypothetical protein [Chloroflexota bacterium]